MKTSSLFVLVAAVSLTTAGVGAQNSPREQLAHGQASWNQRLSKSAIESLEAAARDRSVASEAHEALGRIYTFKGWQQESAFPGWHDEPAYRARAIAELKAAVTADPGRASAKEALTTAEGFAAAEKVDPAPPRPEIKELDAKLQSAADAGCRRRRGRGAGESAGGPSALFHRRAAPHRSGRPTIARSRSPSEVRPCRTVSSTRISAPIR